MGTRKSNYETPQVEIVEIELEQALLLTVSVLDNDLDLDPLYRQW